MARDLFPLVSTPEGAATRINCQCGAFSDFYFHRSKRIGPDSVHQVFINRGWRIGRNASRHKCPDCLAAKRHNNPVTEPTQMAADRPIVEIKSPAPGASDEPPRTMSREDGQIIFAKLSECYLGESSGYAKGWHDEAVATDLNCPRKWVEDIREQFFGPIKADQSPEIIELTTRLDGLDALAKKLVECLDDASSVAHDAMAYVGRAKPDLEKLTKDLAAVRGDLRKLTGRAT